MDNGNILIVDDSPQTLRLLTTILSGENYTVRPADSGALALASALASPPDLILLDVRMPEMSGFDVCSQLKQNPATKAIPVIFLSGLSDVDDRVQGFGMGAVDFISKPFQREELLARVSTHLELARLQNKLMDEVGKQTRDLQTAYQELAKASRVKDEFLSTMSHELRTPLTAVLGMAEILIAGAYGNLNGEQLAALDMIQCSGRKLLHLINEILEYTQLEAGQVKLQRIDCSVAELVNSARESICSLAEQKNVSLELQIPNPHLRVWLDPQQCKRILLILLDNAVKFTDSGGRVGITVRHILEPDVVEFEVWDTGQGIAEADLPRLFKPFVQLDAGLNRQHNGSGLSLALAEKMVRLHGGEIRVTSKLGAGSRFVVSLSQARKTNE